MVKKKQRRTALFLVICMVLSMFTSIPVKAAEDDGGDEKGLAFSWWHYGDEGEFVVDDECWRDPENGVYGCSPGEQWLYITVDEKPVDGDVTVTYVGDEEYDPDTEYSNVENYPAPEEPGYFIIDFQFGEGTYVISDGTHSAIWGVGLPDFAFYTQNNRDAEYYIGYDLYYEGGKTTTLYIIPREFAEDEYPTDDEDVPDDEVMYPPREYYVNTDYNQDETDIILRVKDEKGNWDKEIKLGEPVSVDQTIQVTIPADKVGDFFLYVKDPEVKDEDDWLSCIWCREKMIGLVAEGWVEWDDNGPYVHEDSELTKYFDWPDLPGVSLCLKYVNDDGEVSDPIAYDKITVLHEDGETKAECSQNEQNPDFIDFQFEKAGLYTVTYTAEDGTTSSIRILANRPSIGFYSDENGDRCTRNMEYTGGEDDITIYLIPQNEEGNELRYELEVEWNDSSCNVEVAGKSLTRRGALAKFTGNDSAPIPVVIKKGTQGNFCIGVHAYTEGDYINEDGDEVYGEYEYGYADIEFTDDGFEWPDEPEFDTWEDNKEHTGFAGLFISADNFKAGDFWSGGNDQYWIHGESYQEVLEGLNEIIGDDLIEGKTVKNTGYIYLCASSFPAYIENSFQPQTVNIPAGFDVKGINIADGGDVYFAKVTEEDDNITYQNVEMWYNPAGDLSENPWELEITEDWIAEHQDDPNVIFGVATDWAENEENGEWYITKYRKAEYDENAPSRFVCEEAEEQDAPGEGFIYYGTMFFESVPIPEITINAKESVDIALNGYFSELEGESPNVNLHISDEAVVNLAVYRTLYYNPEYDKLYIAEDYAKFDGSKIVEKDSVYMAEDDGERVRVDVAPLLAIQAESNVKSKVESSDFESDAITLTGDENNEDLQTIRDTIKDELKDELGELGEADIDVSLDVDVLGDGEEEFVEDVTKEVQNGIDEINKKAKKHASASIKKMQFFDINLNYKVNGKEKGSIKETSKDISISINLPEEYQPTGEKNVFGKEYKAVVYRYHDGVAEKLSDVDYDPENKKLNFRTDRFSVYAIALEAETPTDMVISTNPTKTTYTAGEKFDATGMVVEMVFADETKSKLAAADYTISKTDALAVTDKEIVITYDKDGLKFTAKLPITVKAASADEPSQPEKPEVGAKETVDGNNYTVSGTDKGKESVTYTGSEKKTASVTIPKEVEIGGTKYKVTAIGDNAFKGNKTLTTVTIPDSVTKIGKNAFKGCTSLKKVVIPKNVTEIGANAFDGCKKLATVTIKGTKLKKIGNNAFKGCAKLKKVVIPKSVTSIGKSAFYNCKALKTVTIKATALKTVGKKAFNNIAKKSVIKVPKKKKAAYQKLLKKSGYKGTVK